MWENKNKFVDEGFPNYALQEDPLCQICSLQEFLMDKQYVQVKLPFLVGVYAW